jgi:hypothetical protein
MLRILRVFEQGAYLPAALETQWKCMMPCDPINKSATLSMAKMYFMAFMKLSLDMYNLVYYPSIYTQGDAPTLKLQGNGNMVFAIGHGLTGCIAVPGTQGGKLTIGENRGNLVLQIRDSNEEVVWKFGRGCYPELEDSCVSVLDKDGRVSWNEYICTFDSEGNIDYKFGLSKDGLFGLWKSGLGLIWRPGGGDQLRGEYISIKDGSFKLHNYESHTPPIWSPDGCYDGTVNKVVLTSDGDVQELNDAGAIVGTLLGSQIRFNWDTRDSVPQLCTPSYARRGRA